MTNTPEDQTQMPTPMPGFELPTAMTRAMLETVGVWNREVGRFIGHRLEVDGEFQTRLAHCTDPAEALDLVSRFFQTAFHEYAEEAQKLSKISAEGAAKGMAAVDSEFADKGPLPIE